MFLEGVSPVRSRWTFIVRALGLLGFLGASLGSAVAVVVAPLQPRRYFQENALAPEIRQRLLVVVVGAALFSMLAGMAILWFGGERPETPARIDRAARRLSPLALLGFLPLLFQCEVWKGHDLAFLVAVVIFGWVVARARETAMVAGPFAWEARLFRPFRQVCAELSLAVPQLVQALPLLLVIAGALGYAAYFGYYTHCSYYSLRSGHDLGVQDNLMWNLLHGRAVFPWAKGALQVGSHGEFLAVALLPFYALAPNAGSLLLIQSVFLGTAAIPLYLVARRHIDRWPACLLALLYLIYPALHGENLYEFHFLPLAPCLFWWAWYFLESRRDVRAGLFVVLALACREEVSAWVAVLGLYLLFSGRRARAGILLATVGAAIFSAFKSLPHLGGDSGAEAYRDLISSSGKGLAGVAATVLGNPGFTVNTLADMNKLVYLLQILAPLAFIPLRRPIGLLLAVPGFLFTLLPSQAGPWISIGFQHSAHWIALLFPGAAVALAWLGREPSPTASQPRARRRGLALSVMVCMALPVSYQYGAILQRSNSYGGPVHYTFGVDKEGERRHEAAVKLAGQLPAKAKVAGGAFITPFISNRPSAVDITQGITDADYIFFSSEAGDFVGDEKPKVANLLKSGEFGVVAVVPPFALAKRGQATTLNQDLLSRWQ